MDLKLLAELLKNINFNINITVKHEHNRTNTLAQEDIKTANEEEQPHAKISDVMTEIHKIMGVDTGDDAE